MVTRSSSPSSRRKGSAPLSSCGSSRLRPAISLLRPIYGEPSPHCSAAPSERHKMAGAGSLSPGGKPDGRHHRQPEREKRRKRGARIDPHGYDAGKKIKGKKRHILVDTVGLLLHAIVHPADIQFKIETEALSLWRAYAARSRL